MWYSVCVFGALVLFSSAIYELMSYLLHRHLDAHLENEAVEIHNNLDVNNGSIAARESHEWDEPEHTTITPSSIFIQIISRDGKLLHHSKNVSDSLHLPVTIPEHKGSVSTEELAYGDSALRVLYSPIHEGEFLLGWVQLSTFEPFRPFMIQMRTLLIISIPLTLILSGCGGWLLARRALAPIDRITKTAQHISTENLQERIHVKSDVDDEVSRLSTTLNGLFARLDSSFQRISQFTADASHELLTPLTVLKNEIEVALRRPRPSEEYQQTLRNVLHETEEMSRIVRSLLYLARVDCNTVLLEKEVVDVQQLFADEFVRFKPAAQEKELDFSLTIASEHPLVLGDEEKLRQVFRNVVDNAIKYTPFCGCVHIGLEQQNATVVLTVSNTGPGIPHAEQERIFERFYRGKNRASDEIDGAGLGLPIAKSIVELHGGSIQVRSAEGQGATFIITLPQIKVPDSKGT